MQNAVKYLLEIMIVVALNLCVIGFAGVALTVSGNNPTLKPAQPASAHVMQTHRVQVPTIVIDGK